MIPNARSGAALILALVLLAALLLLGLPFLYTQSTSLSGTRSYADRQLAQLGRESAENIAIDIAARSLRPSLAATGSTAPSAGCDALTGFYAPGNASTPASLRTAVKPILSSASDPDSGDGSIGIDMSSLPVGFNAPAVPGIIKQRLILGALVTDESGKLDPNQMSPLLWQNFLTALHIADWDDDQVIDPPPPSPPAGTYIPDADTIGQLAQALASVRFNLPGRRIAHLEQLLAANPHQQDPRLRYRLTRAELARMRPYLSLSEPLPGRHGVVDLGTVVQLDPTRDTLWLDSSPDAKEPLLGIGTVLLGEELTTSGSAHVAGMVNGIGDTDQAVHVVLGTPFFMPTSDPALASVGHAVAIEAPAPLDLHQLSVVVRASLTDGVTPLAKAIDDASTLADESVVRTTAAMLAVTTRPDSTSPFTVADLFPFTQSVRSGVAWPPLGIASSGIFSIESAATVTDVLGRQAAQQYARHVVQAIPQEYLLERRWLTQGSMHALLAQRFGSRMRAWPVAYERRLTATGAPVAPDDHDLESEPVSSIAAGTGVQPRTLPDFTTIPTAVDPAAPESLHLQHVAIDWRVCFGADHAVNDDRVFDAETLVPGPAPTRVPSLDASTLAGELDRLRPDGFERAYATRLGYTLAAGGGTAMFVERDATHELGARHLGLWIKPASNWSSAHAMVPILEARMPQANVSPQLDGAPGDNGSQNYLGIYYDTGHELLVVALAPPSIEHSDDTGPPVPSDDISSPQLDERGLSTPGALPLSPQMYADGGGGLLSFTVVQLPNRVLHCYKTPARADGTPHFRAGQWYHLQVAIASDRPDGVSIILDGLVGQDVARAHPARPDLVALGDHYTLPALVLTQPIDYVDITTGRDPGPLVIPTITVSAPAPLTARSLLPSRGMIRIDDEYLSYDGISGNQLLHCVRGQRQNTVSTSPDPRAQFPRTQAHRVGALVVPGGYRVTFPPGWGGKLYRGGCSLGQDVTSGDVDPASPHPQIVWVSADTRAPAVSGAPQWTLPASATSIPIKPTTGVWAQFPNQGVVRFNGQYVYFGAKGPQSLDQISAIDGWFAQPALSPAPQPRQDVLFSATNPEAVELISMHVLGPDPTEDGRYNEGNVTGSAYILSLQDPSGRIEWVRYQHILRDQSPLGFGSGGFFINDTAFTTDQRGVCRTPLGLFPAIDTKVIPVQTELGNPGHWLATGDVVTLMPHAPSTGTPRIMPVQLMVRYAAMDGFPDDPSPAPNSPFMESDNTYVAFAGPLPLSAIDASGHLYLQAKDYDILCGDCWSGEDLSWPQDTGGFATRSPQPRGNLPRMDLWADPPGSGATSPARVYIGSADPDQTSSPRGSDMTVDGICAGGLTHAGAGIDGHESSGSPANPTLNGIEQWFQNGSPTLSIGPTIADLDGVVAQATTPLFAFTLGAMGLVEIDGEVFAYRQPTASEASAVEAALVAIHGSAPGIVQYNASQIQTNGLFARLIARGLLDDATGGFAHAIGDGPLLPDGRFHRSILPAKRLPLGPVLQLANDVTNSGWFALTDGVQPATTLAAPASLLCSADGDPGHQELLHLIGPRVHHPAAIPADPLVNTYTTAPWLRGLYNTTVGAWAATDPRPIVIGWWPRYPSAFPADPAPLTAMHYRSRAYSWIGFPVNLYGAYFDPSRVLMLPAPYRTMPLADITVADAHGGFDVQARALTYADSWASMDWSAQGWCSLNPTTSDATSCFMPSTDVLHAFTDAAGGAAHAVDGAELRVSWRYTDPASSGLHAIADASNRAPSVSAVKLRCLAPVRVLESEGR